MGLKNALPLSLQYFFYRICLLFWYFYIWQIFLLCPFFYLFWIFFRKLFCFPSLVFCIFFWSDFQFTNSTMSVSFSMVILSLSYGHDVWGHWGFCVFCCFYWFSFTLSCLLFCVVTFDCVSDMVFEKFFIKIFWGLSWCYFLPKSDFIFFLPGARALTIWDYFNPILGINSFLYHSNDLKLGCNICKDYYNSSLPYD